MIDIRWLFYVCLYPWKSSYPVTDDWEFHLSLHSKKAWNGPEKIPSGMEMIGSSFWNHAYADRLQMFYLHFIIGRHVSIFGGGSIDILKPP
jgi:hypothetical protein